MNLKIPIGTILVAIIAIFINHYFLDWNSITEKKVVTHFETLIENQKSDLISWLDGDQGDDKFSKRISCNDTLIRWSDDAAWINFFGKKEIQIVDDKSGTYLIQQFQTDISCLATSIYPLVHNYSITNQYLKSRKNIDLPKDLVSVSGNRGSVNYQDLIYFEIAGSPSKGVDALCGILIIVSLLIIFWVLLGSNYTIVILALLIVRVSSLYFGVLEEFFSYALFDSIYYTSSIWNPTLGDLLINCALIFIAVTKWSRKFRVPSHNLSDRWIYVTALVGILISISVYSVVWSILDNSQISMDVGKTIEFGLLRSISYISVLLMAGSQFLILFRLTREIRKLSNPLPLYGLLVLFSGFVTFFSIPLALVSLAYVFILFIASRLNWGNKLKEFKYENLQFVLIVSINLAFILSLSAYKFHEKSELDAKRKFANHLLIKRDVLGEYYLNQILTEIEEIGFGPDGTDDLIAEVNFQLLNTYFDKYEISLLTSEMDSVAYRTLNEQLCKEVEADYLDIYFLDQGTDFRYVCKTGNLLIILELRKRVPTSVFPALLTDSKYFTPSEDFDYAVFKEGEILFQRSKFGQGEWPEVEDFRDPKLYSEGIEKNERHYYGVNTIDGRVILIISKKYSRRMQLTNFAFFFLLNLFFLGGIVLISSINLREARLNFTGKIQLYLGLAFVVPLFSAGFALLNYLNSSYREEINRNYLKRSLYISELLSNDLESSVNKITSEKLADIRDIIQADVSLYNEQGILLATSQREIFDLSLLSDRINPIVFSELVEKENQSMIADATIGELDYKVSYATLNDQTDRVVGFIAMPFFDSKNHLRRQQLEVFGSLTDIFGFIFIIAILFGSIVLNNLMHPLRMVADKIRQVTLQEENKPIVYESSDEIGSLVGDYNLMLVKLEESKRALARSQKETAWKEIARQVAHEIKNPLTPMQLKIQQLLRKSEEGSKDYETLTSLLSQVDTMSQVASSFSAFAEMPAPNNSTFDFGKLINQVVELYQSDNVHITTVLTDSFFINADEDIFKRILNNIVLNAIQSVEEAIPKINVRLKLKNGKCELSIEDNGKGITEELRDKIFLRYFSTKSSGSGIGLALAKKGIENAGGNIWFESREKEGTIFFISMPLADS